MPRPRVPWWLFVLALSFLAFFIFATYCRFWNPEPEGFHHQFRSGHMIVLDVIPNSPAETAGLKPGDRIASVNGQILGTASDWFGFRANIEVNRPLRLGIERGGETRSVLLILNKRAWNGMPTTGRLHVFAWTALQFLTLVMAFVIAYNSANRRTEVRGVQVTKTLAAHRNHCLRSLLPALSTAARLGPLPIDIPSAFPPQAERQSRYMAKSH